MYRHIYIYYYYSEYSRCRSQNLVGILGRRNTSSTIDTATKSAANTTTTPPAANAVKEAAHDQHHFIKQVKHQKSDEFFRQTWFSDMTTYPIIATLAAALLICAGRCVHGFFYNDDVKVNPNRRGSVVRSYEEKDLEIKHNLDTVTSKAETGRSFMGRTFGRNFSPK